MSHQPLSFDVVLAEHRERIRRAERRAEHLAGLRSGPPNRTRHVNLPHLRETVARIAAMMWPRRPDARQRTDRQPQELTGQRCRNDDKFE